MDIAQAPNQRIGLAVWRAGGVTTAGSIGVLLSLTSINLAFEEIGRQLGAEVQTVQWITTGYLLGSAGVVATTGWLVRRIGARRLYLVTLGTFVATSMLCALASSIEQLIAFRLLQGIAGGAAMPVGQMILVTVAGPSRMARVTSALAVPLLLGPLLGPAVGGLIVDAFGWRWIFVMNVPPAVAALVLGTRFLPRIPPTPGERFDSRGFVMVVLGLPLLVYGIVSAGNGNIAGGLLASGAGLTALVAYVVHALRLDRPLLDMRLWRNPSFASCAISALLVNGSVFGSMVVFALYLQLGRGETAVMAGLLLMPQALGAMVSMTLASRLSDRVGAGRVAVAGVLVATLMTVPLAFAGEGMSYWGLAAVTFLRGFGIGGAVMPAMAAAYLRLRQDQVADATPQLNMLQRIGGSLGTAILAILLAHGFDRLRPGTPPADAFAEPFAWAAVMLATAIVPALVLARIDGRPAGGARAVVIGQVSGKSTLA